MSKRNAGAAQGPLLLLLALLVGGGGYNYWRNTEVERSIPRPYRSYSEADLAALLEAYEQENQALESRYDTARNAAPRATPAGGLIGDKVRAFEEAQRRADQTRAVGGALSMKQAAVQQIEAEQARRADESKPLELFMKRLLTI